MKSKYLAASAPLQSSASQQSAINAIIIEDEKIVSDHLASVLKEIDPSISIIATLQSVEESIAYLSKGVRADLIFSDIQLEDGTSFSIFNHVHVTTPVVFITCYDQFVLNAFGNNGIDYLLKPFGKTELSKALEKYKNLKRHFSIQFTGNPLETLTACAPKKRRVIVQRGTVNTSLLLKDVVLFYTENKVIYVIDRYGKKYLSDKNLADHEKELDQKVFFRANRQCIINIDYIKCFKTHERVKLMVELTLSELNFPIIVSQETAPYFRHWMLEL